MFRDIWIGPHCNDEKMGAAFKAMMVYISERCTGQRDRRLYAVHAAMDPKCSA